MERLHRHLSDRCGAAPVTLMTGGAAWKVAPWLTIEHELVDSLIFDGLLSMQSHRLAL
jgi:type III pantothenate kinase